jgi:hypothetical protein
MPVQETFLTQRAGNRKVEVIKTYDQSFAREAFGDMGDEALKHLWDSLKPEDIYAQDGLPRLDDPGGDAEAFLWDELCEQAREHGPLLSFFVVTESDGNFVKNLYVSPDWPSAESYAKNLIARSEA